FFFIILSLLFFSSCSNNKEKQDKFLNAYREILLVRETIADSTEANKKVAQILKKYDYDEPTFRKDFFELVKNSDNFRALLDSLRNSIIKDTVR
ncbi:MAG: hypothetical protein N3A67_06755, partial [Ignavibacteria bacterium]|nr:hypothetical protein [Ignavibacteria bacterium]